MRIRMMARRGAISIFLVLHLAAVALWNLPACPLRARFEGLAAYYILPTGLWQYWGMFAPDPIRDTLTAEAMAMDAQGKLHRFGFPKIADYSFWAQIPRVRFSKFTCNLNEPTLRVHREFAARHAVRQMNLPEEAFPVHVELNYQLWRSPPPGSPPIDPLTPPIQILIESYRFPTIAEVRS